MKTGLALALLMIASVHAVSTAPMYDFVRNVTRGVVTGFEGPKYTFPVDLCLNQTYTIALDDDIISITMYVSLQNWTAVDQYIAEAKSDFLIGVSGCDYMKIYDSVKNYVDNFDPTSAIVKAWWNSILIWRNANLFYGKCPLRQLNGKLNWSLGSHGVLLGRVAAVPRDAHKLSRLLEENT